jgi:phosphotransferase system  glucose/maltose/N-acetylglucosamine-specific IIC component
VLLPPPNTRPALAYVKQPRCWRPSADGLQAPFRALMLPIAVLPVAGILLRLGQPDLLDIAFIAAAGDAIFHNLGLLFAIGVAVGFARDGNGAAGLAGVVCFLVATNGAQALLTVPTDAVAGRTGKSADLAAGAFRTAALAKLSVPFGTRSGLIAGNFYNRFGSIKLPGYLAFFGGRRFVPIVSGVAGLALAAVFGRGWAALSGAIDALNHAIVNAGPLGLFAYGLLNRLLLVTGLHHILNNIVWFIIGDFHGASGDLYRFFAGDPSAGSFMAGFFPVMIFGLPAGCFAMYSSARPEHRAEVGVMLLSLVLTAALTDVTESIEFSFMFPTPVLFALHAVLTGVSMVIMDALHVKLGFGFSAGLLDFALNFGRATRPLLFAVGSVEIQDSHLG